MEGTIVALEARKRLRPDYGRVQRLAEKQKTPGMQHANSPLTPKGRLAGGGWGRRKPSHGEKDAEADDSGDQR